MPDHLHLILWGKKPEADIWQAMTLFKQQTGYWFSQHNTGLRWQSDFYDHIIRSDKDWRDHLHYVANNPVRAGLVDLWEDYPFTGALGFDLRGMVDSQG